jgi:hypothetical protein
MYIVVVYERKQNVKNKVQVSKWLAPLPTATEQPGKMKGYLPEYSDQRVARRFRFNWSSLRKICCQQPSKVNSWAAF